MELLPEQERLRREALQELHKMGVNPYPAAGFDVSTTVKAIKEDFEQKEFLPQDIRLAGRIMSRRIMGGVSFVELQDVSGRIQIYISRDELCPNEDKTLYNTVFKKLLDIGDLIGIQGFVFVTKTGEISVRVQKLSLLAKALRPLPVVKRDEQGKVYDSFTDPELRYRQRYVDLTVNPEGKHVFIKRAQIIRTMRHYFDSKGWLEVETPVLQSICGGASARPFTTYHSALDRQLFLRISNELHLKRLIVGGFDGVYEFGKMFRNEGMDRTHNPEFTSMEVYVAYKDYLWMMGMVEECLEKVARTLHGTTHVTVGKHVIDFAGPYKKVSLFDVIMQYAGIDVVDMEEQQLRRTCQDLAIATDSSMGKAKLIDEIFSKTVEAHLIHPTFVTDYPIEMTPLAKKHRHKEGLVERFELFINGKEIANAYSELNNPIEQRTRFEKQLSLAQRGNVAAVATIDYDFLRALEYGMPPTAGLGIGIDRLVMLMTNQDTIQEVLFFPQMRPEK